MIGAIQLLIAVIAAGIAYWLGLYLLSRGRGKPLLWMSGWGLIIYGIAVATALFPEIVTSRSAQDLWLRINRPLFLLPMLFWLGTLLYMLPETVPFRVRLATLAQQWIPALAVMIYVIGAMTSLLYDVELDRWQPAGFILFALFIVGVILIMRHLLRESQPRFIRWLTVAATLFFGLGLLIILFPLIPLDPLWLFLGIGGDLLLLGVAVVALNAFEEVEGVSADMIRSFGSSGLIALVLCGQVAMVMTISTGITSSMVALLLAIGATAIFLQTLAAPLATVWDQLLLRRSPAIQAERAALRAAAEEVTRRRESVDLVALNEKEFVRLTRRALSHMGNLPRLANNPLINLPQVEARLARQNGAHSAEETQLNRASELKALLSERIIQLQPRDKGAFGTTDEWRHYNALYFPYVAGLKPYSRRGFHESDMAPAEQEALAWFRRDVPERTLYNWQNAAARLIALDLRNEIA